MENNNGAPCRRGRGRRRSGWDNNSRCGRDSALISRSVSAAARTACGRPPAISPRLSAAPQAAAQLRSARRKCWKTAASIPGFCWRNVPLREPNPAAGVQTAEPDSTGTSLVPKDPKWNLVPGLQLLILLVLKSCRKFWLYPEHRAGPAVAAGSDPNTQNVLLLEVLNGLPLQKLPP